MLIHFLRKNGFALFMLDHCDVISGFVHVFLELGFSVLLEVSLIPAFFNIVLIAFWSRHFVLVTRLRVILLDA